VLTILSIGIICIALSLISSYTYVGGYTIFGVLKRPLLYVGCIFTAVGIVGGIASSVESKRISINVIIICFFFFIYIIFIILLLFMRPIR